MDLYVLDSQLRRTEIVDVYKSLIWTERYSEYGDFELVVHDSPTIRNLLVPDTKVVILESDRVMVVETIEGHEDDEGNDTVTITGRSLELLLEQRAAMPAMASLTTRSKWEVTGVPGAIVRNIFKDVCVDGDLDSGDILPYYHTGTITPAGNIPEPSESVTLALDPADLYTSEKKICDTYRLGFRIVRNADLSELYFEVYTGNDRTSGQALKSPVIFSKDLDSLSNITELTSLAAYKNVAYVFAKNGSLKVYADNVDESVSGFDRRVLIVNANDIELPAGAALNAAMLQRGKEELANNRVAIAFDGEIPQNSSYVYGRDYGLGDLVELRDTTGKINTMRVTEQIFISDKEGVRSYPTLTFDLLITPGTWLAWPAVQTWSEVPDDTSHEWADLS